MKKLLNKFLKETRSGRYFSCMKNKRRFKHIIRTELTQRLPYPVTEELVRLVFKDYAKVHSLYGARIDVDFFCGQLYRKSRLVWRESFATQRRFAFRDKIQARGSWVIFQDKRVFYKEYADFLHRKWMLANASTDVEQLKAFIGDCGGEVFVKVPVSDGGHGVSHCTMEDVAEIQQLIGSEDEVIMEERLVQCDEIAAFAPSSVNTLRVITIVDGGGTVHIGAISLRMGGGEAVIDNYSSGGISALVDVESGVIFTPASNNSNKQYIFHPTTGKQIVGFKIPDIEGYKQFALQLAARHPEMRYVGWDIMKNNKGEFCVVEGNKDAGTNTIETQRLVGKLPYYRALAAGEDVTRYKELGY